MIPQAKINGIDFEEERYEDEFEYVDWEEVDRVDNYIDLYLNGDDE